MKTLLIFLLPTLLWAQKPAESITELKARKGGRNRAEITLLGMSSLNDGTGGNGGKYYWDSTYVGNGNDNTVIRNSTWSMGAWIKLAPEATTVLPSVSAVSGASGAETIIFSRVVKAGDMGTNKSIRFKLVGQLSSGLVSPTVTIKIKFGSATLTAVSAAGVTLNLSAAKPFIIEGAITNQGSAGAQYIMTELRQGNTSLPLTVSDPLVGADWNIDTTVDQTLMATITFGNVLNAGTTFTPKTMTVLIR
jgi:hypothetical protein